MSRVLELCEGLPSATVLAGETLMAQGGTHRFLAVLKKGKVKVTKDGLEVAMIDECGAIFGEIGVILRQPHSATITAEETSEFYMIENPDEFLWERAEFLFEILRILAHRLEGVTQYLADLKHRAESMDDARVLVGEMLENLTHRRGGIPEG